MTTKTVSIAPDRLESYFEAFTKRFLVDGSPEAADLEIVDPTLGDQELAHGTPLVGITYEPPTNTLEFELEAGDHRVIHPQEVWAVEEDDGFVCAVEVSRPDGTRDVVNIRRVGSRRGG